MSRALSNAEALHDAVVYPLIDALLSRRLQTEEAAIFTLGDARAAESTLVASCLRCLLNGLTNSPRELVASALAVHAADAHATAAPNSREVVTDLLQPVSAGHRGSAAASEVRITSATRGARLLLAAADARPARACVLIRLVARMPRDYTSASVPAAQPGADPRLHLVLLPPSETLASGPAAVSFSFLAGALSALTGGDVSGVPPPRSSKLMLLLRDILRPAPRSTDRITGGGGSNTAGPGGVSSPAQFLCVCCISHAKDGADHALATLKLASRLCSGPSDSGGSVEPRTYQAADRAKAKDEKAPSRAGSRPPSRAAAADTTSQQAAPSAPAEAAAAIKAANDAIASATSASHPATQPWEAEGYEASLWAPSAVAGVANAYLSSSIRQRAMQHSSVMLTHRLGSNSESESGSGSKGQQEQEMSLVDRRATLGHSPEAMRGIIQGSRNIIDGGGSGRSGNAPISNIIGTRSGNAITSNSSSNAPSPSAAAAYLEENDARISPPPRPTGGAPPPVEHPEHTTRLSALELAERPFVEPTALDTLREITSTTTTAPTITLPAAGNQSLRIRVEHEAATAAAVHAAEEKALKMEAMRHPLTTVSRAEAETAALATTPTTLSTLTSFPLPPSAFII